MATKSQVIKKAKSIGARFYESNEYGEYVVEIILPHDQCFAGYNSGVCTQTKANNESMADFWEDMLNYISAPVVSARVLCDTPGLQNT